MDLNPHWRDRIKEIGKSAFEIEEMLRLGFLTEENLKSIQLSTTQLEKLRQQLAEVNQQLGPLLEESNKISNTDQALQEIRSARIARVKAEREVRKARKAAEAAARAARWKSEKRVRPLYLGKGVSAKLDYSGGDQQRLLDLGLPIIDDLGDLAKLIGISPESIQWLCYERGASKFDHYIRFEIPKRSGGKRLISAPKPQLRKAQSWVLKNILENLEPSSSAYAFRPNKSIVDNAAVHIESKLIIKLDLKDFFPSISFYRVAGFFKSLGYNPGIASVLGLICTDAPRAKVTIGDYTRIVSTGERSLPQGACTSPAIANLIASPMDLRIKGALNVLPGEWRYTRYADDLAISSKSEPENIGKVLGLVNRIAKEEGFQTSEKKTRIMRAPRRQSITNLVVSDKISLNKSAIKNYRAFFHKCDTIGVKEYSKQIDRDALAVARGYIAFMHMVDPDLANKYRAKYNWLS